MLDNGNINVPHNARLSGEIVEGFCSKLDVQYSIVTYADYIENYLCFIQFSLN